MNFFKTVFASFLGTTCMTIFSYYLSKKKDRNFREPVLLAGMIKDITPPISKSNARIAGWAMHYMVGVLFAEVYKTVLKNKTSQHPLVFKLLAGGGSGILAVIIWKTTFNLHPHPPKINYKRFYGQLVVAHVIFGAITIFFLQLNDKENVKIGSAHP